MLAACGRGLQRALLPFLESCSRITALQAEGALTRGGVGVQSDTAAPSTSYHQPVQQLRCMGKHSLGRLAIRRMKDHPLPEDIAALVAKKVEEKRANRIPDPIVTLPDTPREFTPWTKRCGLIGVKCGMTHDWDEHGQLVGLTIVWVDKCQVGLPFLLLLSARVASCGGPF